MLVTDGDSEMGQVCLPFILTLLQALSDKLMHQNLEIRIFLLCMDIMN